MLSQSLTSSFEEGSPNMLHCHPRKEAQNLLARNRRKMRQKGQVITRNNIIHLSFLQTTFPCDCETLLDRKSMTKEAEHVFWERHIDGWQRYQIIAQNWENKFNNMTLCFQRERCNTCGLLSHDVAAVRKIKNRERFANEYMVNCKKNNR